MATIDQSNDNTLNGRFTIRYATNAQVKAAQSFVPSVTASIVQVDLKLKKLGSPTGNIWVEIQSNNSGAPSGTILQQSANVDVSTVGTDTFITFTFAGYAATASTTYWLVFNGDYTTSADINDAQWGVTATSYGTFSLYDGTTWTSQAPTYYGVFKEYYNAISYAWIPQTEQPYPNKNGIVSY